MSRGKALRTAYRPIPEQTGWFRAGDGADIRYQIIGQDGPWVAVVQGGRHSFDELKRFSQKIASRGYRVVIHDRRNCGESSLDWTNTTMGNICGRAITVA